MFVHSGFGYPRRNQSPDSASSGRKRPRARKRPAVIAVTASAALALLVGACSSGGGSSSSQAAATGQPDYAFFKGQTIHITVTNSPGSSSAAEINSIQSYLAKNLDAKIDISYNTSPINVGNDVVSGQPNTGLYLGVTDLTAAVIDPFYNQPETFDVSELSYVGGTADGVHAMVACAGAPFQTAEDLVSGKNEVKSPLVYPGESYLSAMLFLKAYQVPVSVLPGYTGQTSFPACLTGQGNFNTSLILQVTNSAGTAVVPGIKPLLLSGDLGPDNPQKFLNGQVPTIAEFAKSHVPTTDQGKQALDLAVSILSSSYPNQVIFGPKGIPADRLLALTDAMQKAEKESGAITTLSHNAIPPGFFGPAAIKAKVKEILGSQKLINSLAGAPAKG